MTVAAERVVVGTAAVQLTSGSTATDYRMGSSLVACNRGASPVDLGDSGVAVGAGFELAPGETVTVLLEPGERVYAVAAVAGVRVDVLRQGLA